MGKSHSLWLVLDRLSIHNGSLELLKNAPVNSVTLDMFQLTRLGKIGKGEALVSGLTKSSTVHFVERSTTGEE